MRIQIMGKAVSLWVANSLIESLEDLHESFLVILPRVRL